MLAESISFSLEQSQTPALFGVVALIVWSISERLMHIFGLSQPQAPKRERLSYYLCTPSYYGAIIFSLLDALILHWATIPASLSYICYIGVPILIIGIVVRIISRMTLGKQFSGHVQTTQDHQLITSGIYRYIRHPAYLAYLCLLIGFPVCFGSIAGFTVTLASGIPALIYRIKVEENALLQWFGREYGQYCTNTKKLLPFVW